jgi:hypothetical protein
VGVLILDNLDSAGVVVETIDLDFVICEYRL